MKGFANALVESATIIVSQTGSDEHKNAGNATGQREACL